MMVSILRLRLPWSLNCMKNNINRRFFILMRTFYIFAVDDKKLMQVYIHVSALVLLGLKNISII